MRALSWWIELEDFNLGNPGVRDEILRRADDFAAAHADTAIVFGAHFRWDFLPYWNILHTYMREVSSALNERGIRLFDHHSCTLTHRCDDPAELPNLMLKFQHHLPFAPSREAAAQWQFNGTFLNSWRVIDARTGAAGRVPQYSAEEFCINNPDFRAAYSVYLKKLLAESGISGLMCDDIIFFGGYYQCSCPHCRAKLGFELPPATDRTFWGNWGNQHWIDYLAMRRRSIGEYITFVKSLLPENFPLMSCCTTGAYGGNSYTGQSPHEFVRGDNLLNLEIVGDEPGNVYDHLAGGSYHAAMSRKYHIPVLSLGYGFFPDSAEHVWALNNLSGFSSWFSTLNGKLGLSRAELATLPGHAAPAGRAFKFEQEHPELFAAPPEEVCGVYFSEKTVRESYFGTCETGAPRDFRDTVAKLIASGIPVATVFEFPADAEKLPCVILPSVTLMSEEERRSMEKYLNAGGTILSFGPDSPDGLPTAPKDDFEKLHWLCHEDFSPFIREEDRWCEVKPHFFRNSSRRPSGLTDLIGRFGRKLPVIDAPGFALAVRGKTIHLLATDYEIGHHPLEQQRKFHGAVTLIDRATPQKCATEFHFAEKVKRVWCPFGGSGAYEAGTIRLTGNPPCVIIEMA